MANLNTATSGFQGWRTLGAAVGLAALGAVQTYLTSTGGAGLIAAPYVGPVLIGIGFAVAYLRSITTTPPGVAPTPVTPPPATPGA